VGAVVIIALAGLGVALLSRADDQRPVRQFLEQSKHCETDPEAENSMQCTYSAERLRITVVGVGTSNAGVAVDGSDEEDGFGVGVFMSEGCIRVAPGVRLKNLDPKRRIEGAFISTWTGDIYDSLIVCGADAHSTPGSVTQRP
jgi:hypothetical protein